MSSDPLIDLVKSCVLSDLNSKKILCCMVNGFENIDKLSKFTDEPLVMKPQWFHSSLAIYLLLTYPSMKPASSFIDRLLGKCESEMLQIATEVLSSDQHGKDMVKHPEAYFGYTIIDCNKKRNIALQIPGN